MKNRLIVFVTILAVVTLLATSCNTDKEEDNDITLSTSAVTFTASGGVEQVTVSSEADWEAIPSANWLEVTRTADAVSISVDESAEKRDGSITIDNGSQKVIITVNQKAPNKLNLNVPLVIYFEAESSTQSVTVNSELTWEAISENEWIEIGNITEDTFDITVQRTILEREGLVTVTTAAGDMTVEVMQQRDDRATEFVYGVGSWWEDQGGGYHIQLFENDLDSEYRSMSSGYWLSLYLLKEFPDRNTTFLDIPAGTYEISSSWEINNIAKGEPKTFLRAMTAGNDAGTDKKIDSGTLTISGDKENYTIVVDLVLLDGSRFSGYYIGPMMTHSPYKPSTLIADVELPLLNKGIFVSHGNVEGMLPSWVWTTKMYGNGITFDRKGFPHGSGKYVEFEIYADDFSGLSTGTYKLDLFGIFPFTIFNGSNTATGANRSGAWYYEIKDDEIVNIAAIKTGNLSITVSEPPLYGMTIDVADDEGNKITGVFDGEATYSIDILK